MISTATCTEHAYQNTEAGFEYTIENVGDVTNIRLKGSLDIRKVSALKRDLNTCLPAGMHQVLFDCGELEKIDYAGIGLLVSLFKQAHFFKGNVKIAHLLGQPRDVFELLGLDRIFDIYAETGEAQGSFARHG